MPKQLPAYISVCAKYHSTLLSMWYDDRKKDKKERTIPLASVISAEAIIIFSLMSFFISIIFAVPGLRDCKSGTIYNIIALFASGDSGSLVALIQILCRGASALIERAPHFVSVGVFDYILCKLDNAIRSFPCTVNVRGSD